MEKWTNHAEREEAIVRSCEKYSADLSLREVDEGSRFGRYYLRGNWTWVEVVTLRHGLYVGGDIETVVFSGRPNAEKYGVRSPLYWMSTRSYEYAAQKARLGNTQEEEWDAECARACVLEYRGEDTCTAEQADALLSVLDREEGEHAFREAVNEELEDSEYCTMGDVVSRRVIRATAVLRRLTCLLQRHDFQSAAASWFRRAA
jgi:hypothetical protein